jgi:hypothetical protein
MEESSMRSIKDLLRTVQAGNETAFDVVKDVLPDGTPRTLLSVVQRQVNAEQPLPPVKAPSPKRAHVFHGIEGFIAYLKKFGSENTVVLADIGREIVSAVLDEKAANGFEVVFFIPKTHPLFEPWDDIIGQWQPLRSFVDFLTENRRAVSAPIGKDLVRILSQIKVSRKIDLSQGFGRSSINGVMVQMDIAGQSKESLVELPDEITINAPLYISVTAVDLTLDLILDATEKDGVVIKVISSDLVQKRTDAFQEFVNQIEFDLKATCTVGLGDVKNADWAVLRA